MNNLGKGPLDKLSTKCQRHSLIDNSSRYKKILAIWNSGPNYYSPALKKWSYTGFAMSFRDSVTAKFKYIFLNFYVCDPTSMNLIPHLVSKVRKV